MTNRVVEHNDRTEEAMNGQRTGKCHVCEQTKDTIKFCSLCKHWFCDDCRASSGRVVAALRHWTGPKKANCCGPRT